MQPPHFELWIILYKGIDERHKTVFYYFFSYISDREDEAHHDYIRVDFYKTRILASVK